MASSMPAHPDTPVTLKVSFQGTTRRLTLPLSEVSAVTLLEKIRHYLSIPSESGAIFERHSDSAARYVLLDPDNAPVWKQLHRAAKAKRKLKLRVSLPEPEEEEAQEEEEDTELTEEEITGPKPVSVEDVVEDESDEQLPQASATIETAGLENAMNNMHLRSDSQEQDCTRPSTQSTLCGAVKRSNFAVCCNNCDRTIPDEHYHCSTCDEGDFDLCLDCVNKGVSCYSDDHWMLKRTVKGDFIVVSTTEMVSPKPKVKQEEPEIKQEEPEVKKEESEKSVMFDLSPPRQAYPSVHTYPHPMRSWGIVPEPMRTCNSCVQELPDNEFLHCLSCDDFDLCKACFRNDQHGHHPHHAFAPAVEGTPMSSDIQSRLAPGRNQRHHAICDGCDKFIFGIRHKCVDCPDWDYCSDCVTNAGFVHPNHRFVPIYEQVADVQSRTAARPCHYGICCDGPLCNGSRKTYIVGDRFKCAVCHDTDFCANCEANPGNTHNKTHPLIKFKTPVRRVEVKTKGEDENGQKMPVMGDRVRSKATSTVAQTVQSEATTTSTTSDHTAAPSSASASAAQPSPLCPASDAAHYERILALAKLRQRAMIAKQREDAVIVKHRQQALALAAKAKQQQLDAARAMTARQEKQSIDAAIYAQQLAQAEAQNKEIQRNNAIADLKAMTRIMDARRKAAATQSEAQCEARLIAVEEALPAAPVAKASPIAIFERDTIADGTVMAPNHVFEQTWVLRNGGDAPWPAGCSVKFVGGDYMGHVDSSHPAGIHDLVSASESTVCYDALAPGQEFPFTVLLRTPAREGKVISYWRLQSDDGLKFGHRLWCDVSVQKPKAVEAPEAAKAPEESAKEILTDDSNVEQSAASSQMIFPKLDSSENLPAPEVAEVTKDVVEIDYASPDEFDFETIDEDETWAEDSDEGILTDEDYDILDASDEEYIYEQLKKTQK